MLLQEPRTDKPNSGSRLVNWHLRVFRRIFPKRIGRSPLGGAKSYTLHTSWSGRVTDHRGFPPYVRHEMNPSKAHLWSELSHSVQYKTNRSEHCSSAVSSSAADDLPLTDLLFHLSDRKFHRLSWSPVEEVSSLSVTGTKAPLLLVQHLNLLF